MLPTSVLEDWPNHFPLYHAESACPVWSGVRTRRKLMRPDKRKLASCFLGSCFCT